MRLNTLNRQTSKKKKRTLYYLTCIGEEKSSSQSKPRRPENGKHVNMSDCLPLLESIGTAKTKLAIDQLALTKQMDVYSSCRT